jgi:hypothetical protein
MSEILDFFADNPEVTQAIAKSVPAIMGMHQANKAKGAMDDYQETLDNIDKSRQKIVNPYANVTNPFANLQVATKAAEMQAEQTDIALANTLDTLRETGAGGATALAQAALQSKQGITASIQKQEVNNQRLAAQGEQRMEQLKGAGEARRMQMQEMRDVRDINRLQQNIDIAQRQRVAGLSTAARAGASAIAGLSGSIKPEARNVENSATETTNNQTTEPFVNPIKLGIPKNFQGQGMIQYPMGQFAVDPNQTDADPYGGYTAAQFYNPNVGTTWGKNLGGMIDERNLLLDRGESTTAIQQLIDDTRQNLNLNQTNQ